MMHAKASVTVVVIRQHVQADQVHSTVLSYIISHHALQAPICLVRCLRGAKWVMLCTWHYNSPLHEQQRPVVAVAAAPAHRQQLLQPETPALACCADGCSRAGRFVRPGCPAPKSPNCV